MAVMLSALLLSCAVTRYYPNKQVQVRLVSWITERHRAQLTTISTKGDTMLLYYGYAIGENPHFRKGMWLTVEYDSTVPCKNGGKYARIKINR